jgi:transposase, IS30 family
MQTISYNRLTFEDREEISRGLWSRESFADIASRLNRQVSTISRDVGLHGGRKAYRAREAWAESLICSKSKKPLRKLDTQPQLWEYVVAKLRKKWSPSQISQRIRTEYPGDMNMRISHESISTYIYLLPRGELKKELISYLRQKKKLRENRKGIHAEKARNRIPGLISIEERPAEVADRTIPGHWESDLVVGRDNKSAIGTIVERTTRTVILVPLKKKGAEDVRKAFARELKSLPTQLKLSLTHYRGSEMSEHQLFTKQTKIKVYFAHPRSPWERGTNENTNGLIRQYFPKGTDFHLVSRKEIKRAQEELNGRPRAVLGWRTPTEVFSELLR